MIGILKSLHAIEGTEHELLKRTDFVFWLQPGHSFLTDGHFVTFGSDEQIYAWHKDRDGKMIRPAPRKPLQILSGPLGVLP